jgi:hypothetical protein
VAAAGVAATALPDASMARAASSVDRYWWLIVVSKFV